MAKNKSIEMGIYYLDKDDKEIKKEDRDFFNKVSISLVINEKKIEKICYIACKYRTYEEATYFKATEHLREVKDMLKKKSYHNKGFVKEKY